MGVLGEMCTSRKSLSELRKPLERYASSGEINTTVADIGKVIDQIAKDYSSFDQDHLDGLTVDCGSWWFNVRPSNTEPLLRLNLEAATRDECDTQVMALLATITAQ
jgi:phosphomannomutase